jgi:superfamily I DNA/RNA helicase/DNA polymerase III epsilon subunit-like protein
MGSVAGGRYGSGMSFEPTGQQRRAIEAPLGPVLVVAGPGAGKTYCLICRIQHLIQTLGIAPRRICAVTFTNKAAEEIAIRLRTALSGAGDHVTRGTLHALCLAILREYPEQAGLRPGFGIADEDYQHRVLRRLRVPAARHTQLFELFGRHRLQAYPLTESDLALFHDYCSALRERNLVDFDDLVTLAEALIRTHDFVAGDVCNRWDYVLIDEFQDLNLVQYAIVKRLAGRNLFAVGDDEQSIFSWTGAVPKILTLFRDEFELLDPVILDYNRRCSVQIFDAARRLISWNPASFDKQIEARRESHFNVLALSFEDDAAEADWLINDLRVDHRSGELSWGEYAVLYRYHKIGHVLEGKLIRDGIPCRLAKGQALLDDEVIAYVIATLRLIRSPDDPLVLDHLAELLLPPQLLQDVRVASPSGGDLLGSLRIYAQHRPRGDADGKKIWRFIFHVENLRALAQAHESLPSLVDELLSQRIGPARNPLEERYQDLTDPEVYPGAAKLAERLRACMASGGQVWVERDRGVEIALIGMLRAAQVGEAAVLAPGQTAGPHDVVLRPAEVRSGRLPLLLFKALQLLHKNEMGDELGDFVAFDLETTDGEIAGCEIVEIAAVRVRQNHIVEEFRSLVRCGRCISPLAHAVHGYSDSDLQSAPTFAEIWPRFRSFVGRDLLVAHNGQEFDVPVLRRLAQDVGGIDDLVFYDTLPLVRSLIEGSAKLMDLARRFNIFVGRAHHALPDARMLATVLPRLSALKAARARKAAMVHLLDYLGLSLALDGGGEREGEIRLFRELAIPYTLGRYSDCLDFYGAELAEGVADAPSLAEVIDRLGGVALMERLRARRSAAEKYPSAVARLRALVEASQGENLSQRMDDMLARVTLSSCAGVETDPHRVNLLTLHSTKGLEFSRVYIVGVEDQQLPGWKAIQEGLEEEIQEARRLLYVGMTRAKDKLVLTRVERRSGVASGGSLFLTEAGLVTPVVGTASAMGAEVVSK